MSAGSYFSDPESYLALRGVGVVDGQATAFIENSYSHLTQSLHAGDPIARGHLTGIKLLDGIDYQSPAKMLHVQIGHTLNGAVSIGPSPTTSSTSPSGSDDRFNKWRHAHDNDGSGGGAPGVTAPSAPYTPPLPSAPSISSRGDQPASNGGPDRGGRRGRGGSRGQ